MGLSGLFGFSRTRETGIAAPGRYTPVLTSPITSPAPFGSRRRPAGAPVLGQAVPRQETPPPAPPPVGKSLSEAHSSAAYAANRARRRAAAGSLPSVPKPTGTVLTPVLRPATLIGY